ncbi:hypothetical protein U3A55_04310 [Salarchaeum sp. III]|uniref:hypothetical protein n=1 Tax=Salarchaeum sp. III TaxID=3107927 RepID=UPI002EDB1C7A
MTATALAGCSTGTDDTNNAGGGGGGGEREQIDSLNRNYTVTEDSWKGSELALPNGGTIEYEGIVRNGPAVDFYVMTSGEYSHFQNQERFQYLTGVSAPDTTSVEVSGSVQSGDYVFIVDNSNMGAASPPTNFNDDAVDVEVELTLYE